MPLVNYLQFSSCEFVYGARPPVSSSRHFLGKRKRTWLQSFQSQTARSGCQKEKLEKSAWGEKKTQQIYNGNPLPVYNGTWQFRFIPGISSDSPQLRWTVRAGKEIPVLQMRRLNPERWGTLPKAVYSCVSQPLQNSLLSKVTYNVFKFLKKK